MTYKDYLTFLCDSCNLNDKEAVIKLIYFLRTEAILHAEMVEQYEDMTKALLQKQMRSQNCVKCKHYTETEDDTGVHSNCKRKQLICKYCIHCAVKGEFAKYSYCDMWDSVVNENGYCNYGEKHE